MMSGTWYWIKRYLDLRDKWVEFQPQGRDKFTGNLLPIHGGVGAQVGVVVAHRPSNFPQDGRRCHLSRQYMSCTKQSCSSMLSLPTC